MRYKFSYNHLLLWMGTLPAYRWAHYHRIDLRRKCRYILEDCKQFGDFF